MTKLRSLLLVAFACALVLSVVACESETSTDGSGDTTATTSSGARSEASAWTELSPAGDLPAERALHSMAYVSEPGSVVLFGGTDSSTFFGDTWEYDVAANTWTDLDPAGDVPSGRCATSMVYDSGTGKIVLFGGTDGEAMLDDTWVYDRASNTWTEVTPAGGAPSGRMGHAMTYDSAIGRVILFGGRNDEGFLSDTWEFDSASGTWSLVELTGVVPTERAGHSLVYDPVGGRAIMFGGWDGNMYLNSTWIYDPTQHTWTSLDTLGSAPPRVSNHSAVYDTAHGWMLVFGGSDDTSYRGDTRAYDPATNKWTVPTKAEPRPTARNSQSMVYDAANGSVILFGGWDAMSYFNDTWRYDGSE